MSENSTPARTAASAVTLALILKTPACGQAQPEKPEPEYRPSRQAEPAALVSRDAEGNLSWHRPRFPEREREREQMVNEQIVNPGPGAAPVRDERVLAAMRVVPRHRFVPEERRSLAYANTALPIGDEQTISQPYIVAIMSELLGLKPGDKVLEIGTGSAYQAAVLSELTPHVFTIEILEPLYKRAKETLESLGYKTVQIRLGDGYKGWPEEAPFDAIIVTCGADEVPGPLWEQLKVGGRMVIPVGITGESQRLQVATKREDGTKETMSVLPVRFVPMTGEGKKK